MTVQQVVERTGLKYSTVISWANKGKLPAYKIQSGKKAKYFFVPQEVDETIKKGRIKN